MSGSCPVGAQVCREAHAEVERLRAGIERILADHDDLMGRGKVRHPEGGYWGWDHALRHLIDPTEGDPDE